MSNPNVDLETVIEDSITDAQLPAEPEVTEEASVEAVEAPVEAEVEEPVAEAASTEEPSEDATAAPVKDEFERIAGMPAVGSMGRENRIPYSRVKKITEKAVNEIAEVALGRKLNPNEKAADVVKAHVARIPELESKVTDYETRLTKVGEFEQIMETQPKRFLQMLERVPAYQEFFTLVRQALSERRGGQPAPGAPTQQQVAQTAVPDDMPEPNEELADGTKVYNMEGLKALMAWHGKQTEQRVNQQWEKRYSELESRYRPIESEWRERRHIESVLPVIKQQIAEAKTWPLFDENEAEITQVLEQDPNISLEGAYRKVVFPKLVAERNNIRKQVMEEARTAPRATAVSGAKGKPAPTPQAGPRKLEDIIAEQVAQIK